MKTRIYLPALQLIKLLLLAIGTLPILLAGSVSGQSLEDLGLKINGTFINGERKDFKDYVEWSARVALTVRNDGSKPVILLDRCFALSKMNICSQSIIFFADKLKFSPFDTGEISVYKQSNQENLYPLFWSGVLKEFDQPAPSSRLATIIEPGGIREFSTGFVIRQKIQTKYTGKKKVLLWENSSHADGDLEHPGIPLSDASSFVLSFNFVPMEPVIYLEGNLEPGDPVSNPTPYRDGDFLKRLSTRWSEIGILPLNSGGTFSITSGRIINGEYKNKSK